MKTIECKMCGKETAKTNHNVKYCPECRIIRSQKNWQYWDRTKKWITEEGLPFDLTENQLNEAKNSPCDICGRFIGWIRMIDEQKGYVNGNLFSICGSCSHALHVLDDPDYMHSLAVLLDDPTFENRKRSKKVAKKFLKYRA